MIWRFVRFLALFNTQTRGALLGFFVGVILAGLFVILAGKVNKKIKWFILGLIAVVIIFVGTAFVFRDQDFVKNNKAWRQNIKSGNYSI